MVLSTGADWWTSVASCGKKKEKGKRKSKELNKVCRRMKLGSVGCRQRMIFETNPRFDLHLQFLFVYILVRYSMFG